MFNSFIAALPNILGAAVVLLIALTLANWVRNWASRGLRRVRGLPSSAVGLFSSVINLAVIVLGLLTSLNILGLGQLVISAVASLGIVGLIVGFALQDITKQFASGVMLLLARPFEIGDSIRVGTHEGVVMNLELRTTKLKTAGGDEVLIPNADVYIATVYNLSRYPQRRFAVPIQMPFSANLDALRDELIAAVSAIPGVVASPAPTVVCLAVADQKVSAEVRYWLQRDTPEQDEIITRVIVAANQVLAENKEPRTES